VGRLAAAVVALVLALAFGLTVLLVGDRGDGGTGGGGPTETLAVELGDLFVEPGRVEVPAGSRLSVEVLNNGDIEHDLNLEGEIGTDRLEPGEAETADFGVIDADTEAWCTVPGHREAGMVLTITVTEPAAAEPPAGSEPGDPTAPGGDGEGTAP
jgi:nitrite reductase (NO-forming)